LSYSISAIPREFEIPTRVREHHLALLETTLAGEAHASTWRRPGMRTLLLATALVALAAAAIATAARLGLFDREVTRADLTARVTTITRTISECRKPGDCGPPHTETVPMIYLRASDGITLVAPDGKLGLITPAEGGIGFESSSAYGNELARSTREINGTYQARVELPDGGARIFAWRMGEGHITVTDVRTDGTTSHTTLRSGDVVPLLPGSLDDQPLTPDKAVTFDLARGDYPLFIYPQRNEAYVGVSPWHAKGGSPIPVPASVVRRYELTERDGHLSLPVTPSGGSWSYTVEQGRIRTVIWKAGATTVTVTDRNDSGDVLATESIPIGRRVYAGWPWNSST
jgi:hypothetical protein